jgi:hypothetical protein
MSTFLSLSFLFRNRNLKFAIGDMKGGPLQT